MIMGKIGIALLVALLVFVALQFAISTFAADVAERYPACYDSSAGMIRCEPDRQLSAQLLGLATTPLAILGGTVAGSMVLAAFVIRKRMVQTPSSAS